MHWNYNGPLEQIRNIRYIEGWDGHIKCKAAVQVHRHISYKTMLVFLVEFCEALPQVSQVSFQRPTFNLEVHSFQYKQPINDLHNLVHVLF
jgi:hypothetical protein